MTRGAYMSPLGSSDPLLPDKCFRWAPCPPWLCKCTSGARDYINNYDHTQWQGACLSANNQELISISYEISPILKETSNTHPLSWGPISKYCCVSDPSNTLRTTLNLIDMICPYIGLFQETSYQWYNITSDLNSMKAENSGNISDASVGQVFNQKAFDKGYIKYKVKMSCQGLSNEPPDFCEHYISGNNKHKTHIPTAPPTPAPTPPAPSPGSSGTYTVLSGDHCITIVHKLCVKYPAAQCPTTSCPYICNNACKGLKTGHDISYDCTGGGDCPPPPPTPAPLTACKTYTVVAGDTCSKIATAFRIDLSHVTNNGNPCPVELSIGEKLCVCPKTTPKNPDICPS